MSSAHLWLFHFLCIWNTRQGIVFFMPLCLWNIFPLMQEKKRILVLKNRDESSFEGTHLILWLTVTKDNSNKNKRSPVELMLLGARKFHCYRAGSSIASIIVRAVCARFTKYLWKWIWKRFFCNEDGKTLNHVVQRGDGCLIPGNSHGQTGWGSEQPDSIEDVPACCRAFE